MIPSEPIPPLPFGEEDWLKRSIAARFEFVVDHFPERLAIRTREMAFRYGELNRLANRLAHRILALRGAGTEVIGILQPDTALTIAVMLAVAKAGKCYLPLDGSHPEARLRHILTDSGAGLVVADSKGHGLVESIAGERVQSIDLDNLPEDTPDTNPGVHVRPEDPFMMLYTSGSTGKPKGIRSSNRARMKSVLAQFEVQRFTPNDRALMLASTSVNAARGMIYYCMLSGASLHPYNPRELGIAGLADWLWGEGITVYHSTPTLFRGFSEFLGPEDAFPQVHLVRLGGEAILKIDHEIFKRHFTHPQARMRVSYASGEAGSIAYHFIDRRTEITGNVVPVGFPSPGREIFIRDEAGRDVPDGEIGEIVVRSAYSAKGYWDRPEQSSRTFWEDPDAPGVYYHRTGDLGRLLPDGRLLLVGRADGMVKIRGNRVELNEVEGALTLLPGIREAAVRVIDSGSGEKRLAGYYVTSNGEPIPTGQLRTSLAERLPDYAVPHFYVHLETMPVNAGGKIDRRALPEPERSRPDLPNPYTAPRSELEAELAGLWAEVLGLQQIGVEDAFFDLGGHSLLATRIIAQVLKRYRVEIPYAALLESQTVAAMAQQIEAHRGQPAAKDLGRLLDEIEALSDEEVRQLLEAE